jgi:hypothetical protein
MMLAASSIYEVWLRRSLAAAREADAICPLFRAAISRITRPSPLVRAPRREIALLAASSRLAAG